MKRVLLAAIACLAITQVSSGLTLVFIEDSPTELHFEMSNIGPTPGDQNISSPSGAWFIYAFVHQFEPGDAFAEIGGFVARLLPVPETIGNDVIFPQIYGLPDFPLEATATGEFGDLYKGTFELLPGSGSNAQEWNWIMTLKTEGEDAQPVSETGASASFLLLALSGVLILRRTILLFH